MAASAHSHTRPLQSVRPQHAVRGVDTVQDLRADGMCAVRDRAWSACRQRSCCIGVPSPNGLPLTLDPGGSHRWVSPAITSTRSPGCSGRRLGPPPPGQAATQACGAHQQRRHAWCCVSRGVTEGAHAVLVLDGAGWHTSPKLRVPANISLLPLPRYAPELNPVENLWEFLRANFLSHRVWDSYDAIVDACCSAWTTLMRTPERVASITTRTWAQVNV